MNRYTCYHYLWRHRKWIKLKRKFTMSEILDSKRIIELRVNNNVITRVQRSGGCYDIMKFKKEGLEVSDKKEIDTMLENIMNGSYDVEELAKLFIEVNDELKDMRLSNMYLQHELNLLRAKAIK